MTAKATRSGRLPQRRRAGRTRRTTCRHHHLCGTMCGPRRGGRRCRPPQVGLPLANPQIYGHRCLADPPPAPLISSNRSAISEGYYRQGGGAYDRSYPDDPPPVYTPSRSDWYWLEDDGGGYKCFGRYGGGGRRDGRDMRGSYRRSPYKGGYGSDFSRNHPEQPPPPPPRRSPLRSVAVPICYDSPSNRVEMGYRDNLPRVTPWRRRESRSEPADVVGLLSVGQTTRLFTLGKEASAQPLSVSVLMGSRTRHQGRRHTLDGGQAEGPRPCGSC
jgi:hypothetical protein